MIWTNQFASHRQDDLLGYDEGLVDQHSDLALDTHLRRQTAYADLQGLVID